ncbi:GNAT family N-acetyltransferase [Oceanobacillus kapialis]|uniref:GNAT family N-acetyltransferase n=1 Tax=Oceanobacillus kapialis TaxID=481353 RepID=UPI00384EB993
MNITYQYAKSIDNDKVMKLYKDAGWFAYTKDAALLQQAIQQSLEVISAWDGDKLVGLIRAVGDGLTILYIQDILVLKDYQNQGIATQLMEQMLDNYKNVRQKVLLTEEAPDVRHFYEKNGFMSCDQGSAVAFARLKG